MTISKIPMVLLWAVVSTVFSAELYSSKFDDVDLEEIFNNERLYQKYFDCIVGKGKCTPDAAQLKDNIPDALENGCVRCNEKQRRGAEKVFKFLLTKKPSDYKILEKMFDPEGVYKKKYDDKLKLIEEGKSVSF